MKILDTDHVSEFLLGTSPAAQRLFRRLDQSTEPVAITIVSIEELMRGWLSLIHRQTRVHDQAVGYAKLQKMFEVVSRWLISPWDVVSADISEQQRRQKVRIWTMDLKIASIALAHRGTVLTRNRVDFENVPNLTIEDWLQ